MIPCRKADGLHGDPESSEFFISASALHCLLISLRFYVIPHPPESSSENVYNVLQMEAVMSEGESDGVAGSTISESEERRAEVNPAREGLEDEGSLADILFICSKE